MSVRSEFPRNHSGAETIVLTDVFFFSSLANTELRLILSRLIYNFEFELENPDFNWLDEQTARIIRVKPPLVVRAKVDEQAK